MKHGIKLLVVGFESSAKSTLTSKINDVFVINFDHKEYQFKVPHINIKEYKGIQSVIDTIANGINKYKEKMGKLPKTIVIDTVTQLYMSMQKWNGDKYTGFTIHNQNASDTVAFNQFIENSILASGINCVIVAHTTWDADTARHTIPASGQFGRAGGFLSIVNNAIFLNKKPNKIEVILQSLKYPARTTLENLEKDIVDIQDYNINEHITKLENQKVESEEFCFD